MKVITHETAAGRVTLCADGRHDAEYLSGVYYGVYYGAHEGRCDICDRWCPHCGRDDGDEHGYSCVAS